MYWLVATLKSSIGRKSIMAVSGLLLTFFLLIHLLGNSMAFWGRDTFNAYAEKLHSLSISTQILEVGLAIVFVIHIYFGLGLFIENLDARPTRYEIGKSSGGNSFTAKTMPYTGILVLIFIFHHLARFYFSESELVSDLVRNNLSRPVIAGYYIFSLLALTLHTGHGFWSMFQTMGLSHPKYDKLIKGLTLATSIVIGAVFMMIPILALLWPGFLK